MFLAEIILGFIAESTALIADSLDMLADAAVYGISLYAVGRQPLAKVTAARLSGISQIVLGGLVALDILRRLVFGSEPESLIMIVVGVFALAANSVCLKLISRHKDGEVHMRASWIFSKNDLIANLGVILAGILVATTGSRIPDLVIGVAVATVVLRGGFLIFQDARRERVESEGSGPG